jgi:hypothetical protein
MSSIVRNWYTDTNEDGAKFSGHYIYFNSCPILDDLTNNWQAIRDEYFAQLKNEDEDSGIKANYVTEFGGDILYTGEFKSMPLMLRSSLIDKFEADNIEWDDWLQPGGRTIRFYHDRLDNMPIVDRWLMEHIDIVGSMTVNVAIPGCRLNHHYGLNPDYLRLHLVLQGAEGCEFDIENERHTWQTGELFAFDDCHVFHGTRHTGTVPRIIMLIDIDKKALKPYAKTWPVRHDVRREYRPVVTIASDW